MTSARSKNTMDIGVSADQELQLLVSYSLCRQIVERIDPIYHMREIFGSSSTRKALQLCIIELYPAVMLGVEMGLSRRLGASVAKTTVYRVRVACAFHCNARRYPHATKS